MELMLGPQIMKLPGVLGLGGGGGASRAWTGGCELEPGAAGRVVDLENYPGSSACVAGGGAPRAWTGGCELEHGAAGDVVLDR